MDCLRCNKGKIRVIEGMVCSCGHHMLACDNIDCMSIFVVECGPPFDGTKLPPEFPMTVNESMMKSMEKVNEDISRVNKDIDGKNEFHRLVIEGPLIEDFKKKLAEEPK